MDQKTRYRWVFQLANKEGPTVAVAIKGFFQGLFNRYGRYPSEFHYDGGDISEDLVEWLASVGTNFTTFSPYIHE